MILLLPELSVVIAASATVTMVLALLYREERTPYLLLWALGWGASTLRYGFDLLLLFFPDSLLFFVLNNGFAITNAILLLWGTLQFLQKPFAQKWLFIIPAGLLYLIVGHIVGLSFALQTLPIFFFSGIVYIYMGVVFLRSDREYGVGRLVAGYAVLIWGLHKFDYPFLRFHEELAPWGFLLGATLELLLAFGVFLTFLRKSYHQLEERDRIFRFIMTNARDMIFRARAVPTFHFEYISPALETILGYKPEEFYADPELGILMTHPDDRSTFQSMLAPGREPKGTSLFRGIHKDGHIIWLEVNISHVHDEEGRLVAFEGILRDVTPRRLIEEQLRQSQKMEAIGLLAGGIAHDFNNLLTAISGHADLARLTLGESHPAHRDLDEITHSTGRASELTRQLLAYSRKQTMRLQVINLNDTLRNIESMLRRLLGETILLDTAYEDALWSVRADPTQIEQVVINLAVNARDAMPKGGKLVIRTANAVLTPDPLYPDSVEERGEFVMISVADTGVGIAAENLQRIFDPFFTTKDVGKGTGLGLSTVFGIIKQSNGHIRVASQIDGGSEFRVYFPMVAIEATQPEPPPPEVTISSDGTESVLLVEDNDSVRDMAARVLSEHGYNVTVASNGSEAIQRIEQDGLKFEVVIADVVMPEMGGVELATRILNIDPGIRLLFISGYTAEKIHSPVVGSIPLLSKPFRAEELARKVREILDLPSERTNSSQDDE